MAFPSTKKSKPKRKPGQAMPKKQKNIPKRLQETTKQGKLNLKMSHLQGYGFKAGQHPQANQAV